MIQATAFDQPDVASCPLDERSERPRLSLELITLEFAVGKHNRTCEVLNEPTRAELSLHLDAETNIIISSAQPDRMEIVDPADAQAAFDDRRRQRELAEPIGRQDGAREVSSGGMAGQKDAFAISAELFGVAVNPSHGAADLINHLCKRDLRKQREVHRDEVCVGIDEDLCRERTLVLAQGSPGAAMDEDMHRRIPPIRRIDVDGFGWRLAVGKGARRSEPGTHLVAFGAIALDHFHCVGSPGPLIVLPVELRLIVIEEDRRAHSLFLGNWHGSTGAIAICIACPSWTTGTILMWHLICLKL